MLYFLILEKELTQIPRKEQSSKGDGDMSQALLV